jgi:hypothetical protein
MKTAAALGSRRGVSASPHLVQARHTMPHAIAHRFGFLLIGGLLLSLLLATRAAGQQPIEFNRHIRPILSDKCFGCHGPDDEHREADLRLDQRETATRAVDGNQAIVPHHPEQSLVVMRIESEDEYERMPPADSGKSLSKEQIALLRQWIAQGASYEQHWSYIPPRRPAVPQVAATHWPRNDVDCFILARLEREGLSPSPPADHVTLIRRLYQDLLGLPPTPDEAAQLPAGFSDTEYEQVVDRLLASKHFGERMAMYWLDLVRYADSVGYHGDQEHAITPYRDYVINAFNDNMPFDQFTIEQIAGDLLPDATVDQKIASGYNRVLQTSHEGGVQIKEYLAKYSADRVRNLSSVWMGGTMGCAECHNHKYDPYTQRDFYSLAAFFADVDDLQTFRGGNTIVTARLPEMDVLSPTDRERLDGLERQMQQLQQTVSEVADSEQSSELQQQIASIKQEMTRIRSRQRRTMITAAIEPRTMRILPRGDWLDDSGPVVTADVPQFLPPLGVDGRTATRLDLARWLVRPDNPQTARVLVNRLWYLMFGAGLAPSLDDHGSQTEPPSYPQLLDYLAVELVESGWDVKRLIRMLVVSRTYRQASLESESVRERDPQNRLFARQGRWRLPAESVRDTILRASGLLNEEVGGDSARPYQPDGYYRHLNFPERTYRADKDQSQYRRGVYVHWQRQFLHPMLLAFDAPTREECTAKRSTSNTPTAALTLLNDPSFVEAARVFAQKIMTQGGDDVSQRIRWAWKQALTGEPAPREVELLTGLYDRARAEYSQDVAAAGELIEVGNYPVAEQLDVVELAAWTTVSRAIFNLNQLITRN